MTEHMLTFVTQPQRQPRKRSVQERRADFAEITLPFDEASGRRQSSRCSQCGVPFCQAHCPLQNNIPDWLMLTAAGRMREAWEMAQLTNVFPEICGRICPQDRLCEGGCVIEQSGHGAVTIGSVEKHIGDTAWREGWVETIRPVREYQQTVGIIGAGPAGLAAAARLRQAGYIPHLYDRHDRAGGLMTYGIPGFKLDKAVVDRRVDWLRDSGVRFHLNQTVGGKDGPSLPELRACHDALLIAAGACKARTLDLPNADAPGILPAMRYLIAGNRRDRGELSPDLNDDALNAAGRRVVVIGGGDTAMDCLRTAVRQGAQSVTCLYRRDRENMPGSRRETENAEEEGVQFVWLTAPDGFELDDSGHVAAVKTVGMRLSAPDGEGRRTPKPIAGSMRSLPADMVILALGFQVEPLPTLWKMPELPLTAAGGLAADAETGRIAIDGLFAAGDVVRGADLLVWAVRDGQAAAAAIDRYLAMRRGPGE